MPDQAGSSPLFAVFFLSVFSLFIIPYTIYKLCVAASPDDVVKPWEAVRLGDLPEPQSNIDLLTDAMSLALKNSVTTATSCAALFCCACWALLHAHTCLGFFVMPLHGCCVASPCNACCVM